MGRQSVKWNPQKQVVESYAAHRSVAIVARVLHISQKRVFQVLQEAGVEIQPNLNDLIVETDLDQIVQRCRELRSVPKARNPLTQNHILRIFNPSALVQA